MHFLPRLLDLILLDYCKMICVTFNLLSSSSNCPKESQSTPLGLCADMIVYVFVLHISKHVSLRGKVWDQRALIVACLLWLSRTKSPLHSPGRIRLWRRRCVHSNGLKYLVALHSMNHYESMICKKTPLALPHPLCDGLPSQPINQGCLQQKQWL